MILSSHLGELRYLIDTDSIYCACKTSSGKTHIQLPPDQAYEFDSDELDKFELTSALFDPDAETLTIYTRKVEVVELIIDRLREEKNET